MLFSFGDGIFWGSGGEHLYTEKVSNEKHCIDQPIENNVILCISGNNVDKK